MYKGNDVFDRVFAVVRDGIVLVEGVLCNVMHLRFVDSAVVNNTWWENATEKTQPLYPPLSFTMLRSALVSRPLLSSTTKRAFFSTVSKRLQQQQQQHDPKLTHFGFRNVPEEQKESLGTLSNQLIPCSTY